MVFSARPEPILKYVFPSFGLKQRYIVGPFPGPYVPDTFHSFGQKCDQMVVNRIDLFSQKLYLLRKARRPIGGYIAQLVNESAILGRSHLLSGVAKRSRRRTMDLNHQTIKKKVHCLLRHSHDVTPLTANVAGIAY